jgi:hypothetical protein
MQWTGLDRSHPQVPFLFPSGLDLLSKQAGACQSKDALLLAC